MAQAVTSSTAPGLSRLRLEIRGIVQGVGFRPFIYGLARRLELSGWVLNDGRGVIVEIEGPSEAISRFEAELVPQAPPLSAIEEIRREALSPLGEREFTIRESRAAAEKFALISPDIATCEDCLAEMRDPADRRFGYPFLNCTNCGPRFTIIRDVPYDRGQTTMAPFPMCPDCRREYEDPANRRFHAQPTACPICGPKLRLTCANSVATDPLAESLRLLREGKILAIKGIGGFHLACDARNDTAVAILRARKFREDKPFALMASDVERVREFCEVSEAEERLLRSVRRPIVLLSRKPGPNLASAVAPGQKSLGFMLPYSPLHHLLFEKNDELLLVMTSGNLSDEPIAYRDDDARERLGGIADAFLIHDREIHMRCDDSVARVFRDRELPLRRSRGYVPGPIKLARAFAEDILAVGAEQKNTFCLGHAQFAFVGHHVGDLENAETLRSFEEGIEHFKRLFNLHPRIVSYDLHPEYLSTKYAQALPAEMRKLGVQHHHAHIASCLADNDADGPVIGIALDGTGYGEDGKIWGGEILIADTREYRRAAHLKYLPMPGGAKAVREPWRMAAVCLEDAFGPGFGAAYDTDFARNIDFSAWRMLSQAAARGLNSPMTSSMGRLFDAVSALIGIRGAANYEGQAAIELEMAANPEAEGEYPFDLLGDENLRVIDPAPMIRAIVEELRAGCPTPLIAGRFHHSVGRILLTVCRTLRRETGLATAALSGGVFQNMLLLERTVSLLEADGFQVLTHRRVPPNDGGISLGQAVIAARVSRE